MFIILSCLQIIEIKFRRFVNETFVNLTTNECEDFLFKLVNLLKLKKKSG